MAQLNTRIILRNDSTANWEVNLDQVLLKGEVGVEFLEDGKAKLKIGDGVKTWAELPYFNEEKQTKVFETEIAAGADHNAAINTVVGDYVPVAGDICIVKELIADDKREYTAYVYGDAGWAAMDGNYNAKNVYFDSDFVFTKAIGTVTIPSSGSTTVDAEGKNLQEFFAALFAAEQQPTKTEPSVGVTLNKAGAYEVGTEVTGVKYTATFEDGKYTYGPEPTGVTVESWEVKDGAGAVVGTAASADLANVVVADGTNFKVTAKATHTAGSLAKTNIGNESTVQIAAGNKSATSSAITGYRSFFYGVLDTSTAEAPLTSEIIRGMTNGKAYNGAKEFTLNGSTTAKRIVIAIPGNASRNGLKEVILTSAMNTPVTDSYKKTADAVEVEGANGATAIAYDVWVYEPAAIDAGEVHKITLY